jgi:hypothetical protein
LLSTLFNNTFDWKNSAVSGGGKKKNFGLKPVKWRATDLLEKQSDKHASL